MVFPGEKKKPTPKHKVTLAKLRAKKEVLAHLRMNLVGSSVLGDAEEAAGLESTESRGAATGGIKAGPWLGQPCEKKHVF